MQNSTKALLIESHRPRWRTVWTWLGLVATFVAAEGLLGWVAFCGYVWLTVPLVLLVAHLMHAHLIAFHEAAHETLCPFRWGNHAVGLFIGTFSLMGFSLYRALHWYHHAYLATEKDEELWPFVIPGTPRWARCLAAAAELLLGFVYTPLLFLRGFLRRGSPVRGPGVRRRIWAEFALMACVWALLIAMIVGFGVWRWMLLLYVVPGLIAGTMQSVRKYIEHMGLAGSTVFGSTRSVIPHGPWGRLVAFSLFNEPYHGVHHMYARLPQDTLPEFASILTGADPEQPPHFPSYGRAFLDMIGSLRDPRVGAQWRQSRGKPNIRRWASPWRGVSHPAG